MSVRIGLVGIGTVGGGCIDILAAHSAEFSRYYGVDIELARVCSLEPEQAAAHGVADIFTMDYHDILDDPTIDLVVELIGGVTVAREVVLGALRAGKHVVTANKALLATHGRELLDTAAEAGRELAFEASVGGGIPIIGPLTHSLIANEVSSVMGIVNGTTNYMLTAMAESGLSYEEALAQAQANGFAEADPTADVGGFDAAAKIAILATIAFHTRVTLDDVYTDGITAISPVDLEAAREMDYAVKLLAIAHRTAAGIDVRVHPTMIPLDHQLAKVDGVFNAIYVVGDAVGETMFFGKGAGAGPAASAVMGDVLEVARRITRGVSALDDIRATDELPIAPIDELETRYYIRFVVADRAGVLATMASVFARHGVSVRSVVQRGQASRGTADLVYVTHHAKESAIRAALTELAGLDDVVHGEPSLIRVED